MNFIEAVKKGIELVPTQLRGRFTDDWLNVTAACVLGTAVIGQVGRDSNGNITFPEHQLEVFFKEVQSKINAPCPEKCSISDIQKRFAGFWDVLSDKDLSVKTMMVHLNDHHKWTREQIIEWFEPIADKRGWL